MTIFSQLSTKPLSQRINPFRGPFHAIDNKLVLSIEYKGFNHDAAVEMIVHPYYLKQFNNRWFLFGFNSQYQSLSNLPLDRIVGMKPQDDLFIENADINFEDYFEDVVGVTVDKTVLVDDVLLKVDNKLWRYIETKPIHGSQKVIERSDAWVKVKLKLRPNYELETMLFSYGEQIEIIAPIALRAKIKSKAEQLFKRYF